MTRWIEIWAVCVLYTALVAPPAAASTAPSFPERKAENAAYHRAPHIEVALIANVRTIVPGKPFRLGIHQRIETHWHTYWKNPGDSGLAPTARWSAPPSITVDPLRWPTPRRIRVKHLANYGYESDVLLIAPARVAPSLEGSDVTLQVEFSWLVCREECIPGKANLTLRLLIARGDRPPTPANTALFATFHDRMPRDASGIGTKLFERGERLELVVDRLPLMTGERVIAFLPATPEVVHNAEKERIKLDKGILRVDLAKNEYFQRPRGSVEGVLVAQLGTRRTGWRVFATFVGTPPGTQTPNGKTPNGKTPNGKTPNGKTPSSIDQTRPAKAPSIDRDPKRGGDGPAIRELFRGWQPFGGVETKQSPWIELLQTILFALIAGVMLNLMPCVFPVLSIKVMHIVEQAGGERRRIRDHGLVFLAGVLTTFSVLAVMLLVFRAAGSRIGWGFQLQEPAVVFALAAVLFGVGLNLSGLFEVGETVMGVGQSHAQKGGFAGSFASGVLAVVVATP
ncbi:MAG: hypothetical protein KC609_07375, partial [Myxococcales bacterium]|nr:hypothetical protein [Myxococcales bacterium]